MEELIAQLTEQTTAVMTQMQVLIPHTRYDIMKIIRSQCSVDSEEYTEDGVSMQLRVPENCRKMLEEFSVNAEIPREIVPAV
jgi:50S ribosomal subunit-associated GTPase HflX